MELGSDIAGIISSNTMIDQRSTNRNWADIDQGILLKFFMALNVMDLVCSVSLVCSTWRSVCHEPCLWETLNLSSMVQNQTPRRMRIEEQRNKVSRFLNSALSLSRGKISCLIFNFHIPITNEQLIHASMRTPNLKRLVLSQWSGGMPVSKFVDAARNWPNLKSLTLPAPIFPTEFIEAIAQNCKNFTELKMMCAFDLGWAEYIATMAPGLKVISLRCNAVSKDTILFVLRELRQLEVLNISHCIIMDQNGFRSDISELDESVIQEASRLKKFLFCQSSSCHVCQHQISVYGMLLWPIHDEGIWKMDEVDSLAY